MNTLIAKNLQLGNYLFCKPPEKDEIQGRNKLHIVKIDDIEWMGTYYRIGHLSQEDFEPILLTEEWLDKLDFKKKTSQEWIFPILGHIPILITVKPVTNLVYSDSNETRWEVTWIDSSSHLLYVTYVHDLQNLITSINNIMIKS